MELLDDISVTLKPSQNFLQDERLIEVDLSGQINFTQFVLQPNFSFNNGAFGSVRIDEASGSNIVISIKNDISLTGIEDELAVRYYANSQNGESVTGKVVFPQIEFELGVNPIVFELDNCCSLPDKIVIDVRNYNGNLPVSLTGVGDNNTDAATITLNDVTGSDYNDDFNDDFGMEPNKIITYTLNKTTDFWKTLYASDRFQYNITYKGKTASNFITVKLKIK